jgi:hypothetical protein
MYQLTFELREGRPEFMRELKAFLTTEKMVQMQNECSIEFPTTDPDYLTNLLEIFVKNHVDYTLTFEK